MQHIKERRKIIHKPGTPEIFRSLASMPKWSEILFSNGPDKTYKPFLRWLIDVNYFKEREERTVIKQIANSYGTETTKVTKWLHEIYEDIFDLNYEKRELFQTNGIHVCLYMNYFDNHCTIYLALPALPREFERFEFYFVDAKMGIHYFWVKKVEYTLKEDEVEIRMSLEGGFANRYRQFALDKALFQNWVTEGDLYFKHSFEIDDELRKLFRH